MVGNSKNPDKSGRTGFFCGKAGYYARYRRGYPAEVFDTIVSRFSLAPGSAVLDLGCGTGNVAIPLAQRGLKVCAVDPDPEMRGEGCRRAEADRVSGISWMAGSDATLGILGLPPFRLCTMGLSFHWMDRPKVLASLDTLIEPGGGVACLSRTDGFFSHLHEGWGRAVQEVLKEMLGDSWDYSGRLQKKLGNEKDRHEDVFARSPFSAVEVMEFPVCETFTVDGIIGHQLSTSYIDPVLLSERNAEFRDRLTRRLLALEPSGTFSSESVVQLIIAQRP
jgi:ubiquinone/menaquinone biosynthesis C-methylase UbiE